MSPKAALRLLILAFLLLAISACARKTSPTKLSSPQTGTMEVVATGFENNQGSAVFLVYNDSQGFPGQYSSASKKVTVPIVDGRAVAIFEPIPYGYYAVSVLHDLNQNSKMDRNLWGRPLEPHGISRGAKGFFGPPDFADARFGFFAQQLRVWIEVEKFESVREKRRRKKQQP